MYRRIDAKRSVRKLYTEALVRRGDITLDEAEQALDDFNTRLQVALDEVRAETAAPAAHLPRPTGPTSDPPVATGVPGRATALAMAGATRRVPEGFTLHPKLARQFAQRDEVLAATARWTGRWPRRWPSGHCCLEGVDVRLTGQDTRRGTFSHRHAVLVDYVDRRRVRAAGPSAAVWRVRPDGAGRPGRFTVRDSLLSEYAAVGFEYGYSVEAPGRAGGLGGPVRRFRQRRRDHHRQLPGGGRGQVGPARWPGAAAAPRLRGPGARALLGPGRAVLVTVRPGATCASSCPPPRPSTSTCLRAQVGAGRATPLVVITPKSCCAPPPSARRWQSWSPGPSPR